MLFFVLGCKILDQTNPACVNKMPNMRYVIKQSAPNCRDTRPTLSWLHEPDLVIIQWSMIMVNRMMIIIIMSKTLVIMIIARWWTWRFPCESIPSRTPQVKSSCGASHTSKTGQMKVALKNYKNNGSHLKTRSKRLWRAHSIHPETLNWLKNGRNDLSTTLTITVRPL